MSYIRYGYPLIYVEGNSDDYVVRRVEVTKKDKNRKV